MLEEQQQQLETIMTQISSFPSNTNTNTTTNHETVSNMTAFNDNNTNTDFLVPAAVDNITNVTNNNNNEQLMLSQLSLSVPMPTSPSIPMEDDSDTETTTTTNTITDHRHRHPHNHSHHHNIPSHITLQDQLKSSSASSSSTQLTAPTVPANPGDLTCKVCGRVYSRRDNLLAHQRVHTGAKPYECNTCGKRFRWQSALRNHEGAHQRRGTFPVRRGRIRKVHVIATLAASIAQGEMQNEVQQENVDDVDMEQQQQQQQQTEDRGQGEESMSEVQECIEQAFERDDPVDWISTFIVQPGITLQQQQQQQQRMITPRTDNIMP